MTTPPEVLGYIRTSTHEQGRKFSPASQRISTNVLAKQNGDKIGQFLEDHETGTTVNRKNFQEICRRVERGEVKKVYFAFVDRAFRNTEDALRTAREFAEKGCKLYFSDMPGIDLSTPMGKLMFTHYASFGEFEHARIRQRSMENRETKMQNGKPDSWNLIRGFKLRDGYPELGEVWFLEKLFRMRDQGLSVYAIAGQFEAEGIRPRRARYYRASTLTSILRNRQCIGEYHRCGRMFPIQDRHGALLVPVDPQLFHRVQVKDKRIHRAKVGAPSKTHLLAGLMWDEEPCGGRWVGNDTWDNGKLYRYYRCGKSSDRQNPLAPRSCTRRRIHADPVEEDVWNALWPYITDPVRVRSGSEALAREEEAKLAARGRDPREELAALRARQERVLAQEEDGKITREASTAKIKALRLKMSKLEIEARAISKVVDIAPLDVTEETCRAIREGGEPKGIEDRREVLDGLVDLKIEVGQEEFTITGAVPVGAGRKNCTNRLTGTDNFFAPLPFEIKVKIRAA